MSDQRHIPPDTSQDHSESNPHVDQATPMDLDTTDQPTVIVEIEMEPVQRTAASAVDVISTGDDAVDVSSSASKCKRRTQCKCGSTTHLNISHSTCPFNKKLKSNSVIDPVSGNASPFVAANDQSADNENSVKKCPSCGGTDHQRKSSKKCPKYQRNFADRYKEHDQEESECTVKLGLNTLYNRKLEPEQKQLLHNVIQDAVHRMTEIYCETTKLLQGYLIWILEHGGNIPDIRFSDGILSQFFQAVQFANENSYRVPNTVATESVNRYVSEFYSAARGEKSFCDGSGLSHMIATVAKMYGTNCMVHYSLNMRRYLKQDVNAKSFKRIESYLPKQLCREEYHNNLIQFPVDALKFNDNCKSSGDLQEDQRTLLSKVVTVWDRMLNIMEFKTAGSETIKKTWWSYINPFYNLLVVSGEYCLSEAEQRRTSKIKGRSLRLFNLLPQASHHLMHIPIDSTTLVDLLFSVGLKKFGYKNKEECAADPLKVWKSCFYFDRITSATKRFGLRIATNGVEVSVLMMKIVTCGPKLNDFGIDDDSSFKPLSVVGNVRILGLDPGRRCLYDAVAATHVDGVIQDDNKVLSCSSKRWQDFSGAHRGRQKRSHWMLWNQTLMKKLTQGPTSKCHTSEDYSKYLQHFFSIRDDIFDFFWQLKWHRLKFKTRITRQKAYDQLAKELTKGDPNTIIAYGAGKFDCSSKGHAPTPNRHLFKELKKRCRVRLVSEYRTSQVCFNCHSQLEKVYGAVMMSGKHERLGKNGKMKLNRSGRRKLCWGLKKCINHLANVNGRSFCLTLWDRDVNAALNIRQVFLYRNDHNNESPEEFKRKKKEDEKNSAAEIQDSTTPEAMNTDTLR